MLARRADGHTQGHELVGRGALLQLLQNGNGGVDVDGPLVHGGSGVGRIGAGLRQESQTVGVVGGNCVVIGVLLVGTEKLHADLLTGVLLGAEGAGRSPHNVVGVEAGEG